MKIISTNTSGLGYQYVTVLPSNAGCLIAGRRGPMRTQAEGVQSTAEGPHSPGDTVGHSTSEALPEIPPENKTKQNRETNQQSIMSNNK